MQHQRIFTAINLSVAAVRKLTELQRELKNEQPDTLRIGWVPSANIHVTLKFYGNLIPDQVEAVVDAARKAAAETAPFQLTARGLGVFPNASRPRVLWMGLTEGLDATQELHRRVEDASDHLGFARDERAFRGHVTLGRVRRGAEPIEQWLEAHAETGCEPSSINEIVVYESRLHRAGAEYVSHCRVPLTGR